MGSRSTRFLPGTHFAASFTWADETSFPLSLDWEAGSEKLPLPVARFTGAPQKAAGTAQSKALCRCARVLIGAPGPGEDVCADVPSDMFPPECVRANPPGSGDLGDCMGLLACFHGEPSATATCLPGEAYTGACPSCRCAKSCGPGKPACPKGYEGADNMGRGDMVCMEP